MNHEETTGAGVGAGEKLELSVLLLNASFIAFETLNFANSSASSALGLALWSISVLNGSLYHEACIVSSLKYDRNSETIPRCSMMQVLMLSVK